MAATPSVTGRGLNTGLLSESEVRLLIADGLAKLPLAGRRVLVIIPDSTRTMPMPLVFEVLEQQLGHQTKALDYLVALGTHTPMTDAQLSQHLGTSVINGHAGQRQIFNHRWDDPEAFVTLGTIPSSELEALTETAHPRLRTAMRKHADHDVEVRLNRLILDYDHLLICGPVFPHEVAGFSGGAKYFFPGIAGPEIIHFTHWLGALLTSHDIIGTADTLVRQVIHRATEFIRRPHSLLAPVVTKEGVAGIFCGPTIQTWHAAAELSSRRHIVFLDRPVQRALSILPTMYDDLWTGAKGMYKLEPVIADGGEVVIYAPNITEVSYVHGALIDQIGYHCRDYFLGQWDKFKHIPGGILAHSTHLRGKGTYDTATHTEHPRIQVTLATGIPEQRCHDLNLGYRDPASINIETWRSDPESLVVDQAGEMLYRLK
ncbi:MAG: lactate racemase domain-containing protein [Acidobacteriota bacterium]